MSGPELPVSLAIKQIGTLKLYNHACNNNHGVPFLTWLSSANDDEIGE